MRTSKPAKTLLQALAALIIVAGNADSAHAYTEQQKRLERSHLAKLKADRQKAGDPVLSQKEMVNKRLKKKSRELESVLLSEMIEPMFPKGEDSMLYGDKESSKIYRMFLIQEYADVMSKQGGLGVAEQVFDDLKLQHERKDNVR